MFVLLHHLSQLQQVSGINHECSILYWPYEAAPPRDGSNDKVGMSLTSTLPYVLVVGSSHHGFQSPHSSSIDASIPIMKGIPSVSYDHMRHEAPFVSSSPLESKVQHFDRADSSSCNPLQVYLLYAPTLYPETKPGPLRSDSLGCTCM